MAGTTAAGASSGGSSIADAQAAAESQFEQESVQQMQQSTKFAELQAASSLGNKIAGSNPGQ
jgi:hypothetical protein